MNPKCVITLLIVAAIAFRHLKSDYLKGLCLTVGFIISMPDYMRISFGGGIPEMTVQRVLVMGAVFFWLGAKRNFTTHQSIPFKGLLLAFTLSQLISTLLSANLMAGVKSLFVFTLENLMLFIVVSTTLQDRAGVLRMLTAIGAGLGGVAGVAMIERFKEINISLEFFLGEGRGLVDITATYPHRILLGYAMAMAVPILMAVREHETQPKRQKVILVLLLLTVAGCYFANSRGPWSGLVMAGGILLVLGSNQMRKSFVMIGVLSVVVIIARPGVRETLVSAISTTVGADKDSVKRKSYEYRWKLWEVAYSEVKKSPGRLLFGYGGLSTEDMDLSDYFEKESGGNTALLGFTSWDNQQACDLIEFGFVGSALEVILFIAVLWKLLKLWKSSQGVDRTIMAAFISITVIFFYARSNVYLFSPQLKCLFWVLVACSIRYGELKPTESSQDQNNSDPQAGNVGERNSNNASLV